MRSKWKSNAIHVKLEGSLENLQLFFYNHGAKNWWDRSQSFSGRNNITMVLNIKLSAEVTLKLPPWNHISVFKN